MEWGINSSMALLYLSLRERVKSGYYDRPSRVGDLRGLTVSREMDVVVGGVVACHWMPLALCWWSSVCFVLSVQKGIK